MLPKTRLLPAVIAAAGLLVGNVRAAERGGVQMPDTVNTQGQNLVLNGLGVREASVLNVKVYVAGLYLPQRSSNPSVILQPSEPKALHLIFVRDVSRDQMTKAWQEGFQKNAGSQLSALQPRIDQLNGWMTDTKKGDTATFVDLPGRGVQVEVGNQVKGTIPGDDFAQALFGIWLGPHPPNDGLKEGLLGRQ